MSETVEPGFPHASPWPGRFGRQPGAASVHLHPDDVVADPALTTPEKRAILAGWISDQNAVPDRPALRQLENGAIVAVDAVLAALRSLDGDTKAGESAPSGAAPISFLRRRRYLLARRAGHRAAFRPEDDDDPPPGGASAPVPILIPAIAA